MGTAIPFPVTTTASLLTPWTGTAVFFGAAAGRRSLAAFFLGIFFLHFGCFRHFNDLNFDRRRLFRRDIDERKGCNADDMNQNDNAAESAARAPDDCDVRCHCQTLHPNSLNDHLYHLNCKPVTLFLPYKAARTVRVPAESGVHKVSTFRRFPTVPSDTNQPSFKGFVVRFVKVATKSVAVATARDAPAAGAVTAIPGDCQVSCVDPAG